MKILRKIYKKISSDINFINTVTIKLLYIFRIITLYLDNKKPKFLENNQNSVYESQNMIKTKIIDVNILLYIKDVVKIKQFMELMS